MQCEGQLVWDEKWLTDEPEKGTSWTPNPEVPSAYLPSESKDCVSILLAMYQVMLIKTKKLRILRQRPSLARDAHLTLTRAGAKVKRSL